MRIDIERYDAVVSRLRNGARTSWDNYMKDLRARSTVFQPGSDPYWHTVPEAIFRSGQLRNEPLLRDVMWAQACLYLAIRIQDDVLDGHTTDTELVFNATVFLVEAAAQLRQHFNHRSSFWPVYDSYVFTSVGAIQRLHRMNPSAISQPGRLLRLYAQVSAIFKVAPAAICIAGKMQDRIPIVSACFDELAIAGQLYDDLMDLESDAERGQINAVRLYTQRPPRRKAGTAQTNEKTRRVPSSADADSRIIGKVLKHIKRGRAILRPLRLASADDGLFLLEQRFRTLLNLVRAYEPT